MGAGKLSIREKQIAELIAWGAAKKDISAALGISESTVNNTARNIYNKIGLQKATELSAWYFCTTFNISFGLSPIKKDVT